MAYSTMILRSQLKSIKPILNGLTLENARALQESVGMLQSRAHQKQVLFSPNVFRNFIGEWVVPKKEKYDGVILYLHGGGYVSGDLEYAKGFGAMLASKNQIRVFCPAYRLAPEHPFPAALDDAVEAYRYLLSCGYTSNKIILCGESAGGGLVFALTLKLKMISVPIPCAIISISPWTDLTMSGESCEINKDIDPSLNLERLHFFASQYTDDVMNPLVSPIFADLTGLPPSLLFVGSSEILLDDSIRMHKHLLESGNKSDLVVSQDMWHVYVLYGIPEARESFQKLSQFIKEVLI